MKVSVVIPTHNRALQVKKAVQSVLNQTHKELELIIVSDGSTDSTSSIINEIKLKDERVKFISYEKARGGNHARNVGIKACTGEYVAFLDDDDEWKKEKLELQLKEFNKDPDTGLVYTGTEIIYEEKGLMYNSLPKKTGDLSKSILVTNYIGTTSSVMIKLNVLLEAGFFDEELKARQDYDLWIRVCQIAKVGAVFEPLLKYYNFSSNNQVSDDIEKSEKAIIHMDTKYEDYYKNASEKITKGHQQANYMMLATKCLRNNDKKLARYYLIKHFKNKPTIYALLVYLLSYFNYDTVLRLRALRS